MSFQYFRWKMCDHNISFSLKWRRKEGNVIFRRHPGMSEWRKFDGHYRFIFIAKLNLQTCWIDCILNDTIDSWRLLVASCFQCRMHSNMNQIDPLCCDRALSFRSDAERRTFPWWIYDWRTPYHHCLNVSRSDSLFKEFFNIEHILTIFSVQFALPHLIFWWNHV